MNHYLGIDIGTSSVKSLLMDALGHVIGISQAGYDIKKTRPEYAEQDMEEIWTAAKSTISDLVKRFPEPAREIQGISYSGQMHGLVMVDAEGRLIRDAIIWADQRSSEEIEEIYQAVGRDEYRGVILNSLSTGFLITSLMWVKKHEPEHYNRIHKVLFPKDYIRFRMCGEYGTDMSDASSGAVFDTRKRGWAWTLIDKLSLNADIFPTCHESAEIAGTVTKECADATGLRAGISVAYGGGDTLVQGLGNGIIAPGILAANIGTSCQLSGAFHEPLYDAQFRTNTFCHIDRNLWLIMGAHLSGGIALKWLKNNILKMNSFDDMTALAEKAPAGSEGLVFLPYLSGERTPYNDPGAKGIYFGMTLRHSREHMIRSTMEGIVFGLKTSAEILRSLGIRYDRIVASGGGARSRLFRQIQADILDCEIFTNEGNEQAGIGAAVIAAVACGEYTDYAQACSALVHLRKETVTPIRENQKYYEEQFAIFQELYPRNCGLFHKKEGGIRE